MCHVHLHLNFWRGQRFPVVGFELVEFIKLQANVLDRQLEHVPETCQVLRDGPWVCIWVLIHKQIADVHTRPNEHTHKQTNTYCFDAYCTFLLQLRVSQDGLTNESNILRRKSFLIGMRQIFIEIMNHAVNILEYWARIYNILSSFILYYPFVLSLASTVV